MKWLGEGDRQTANLGDMSVVFVGSSETDIQYIQVCYIVAVPLSPGMPTFSMTLETELYSSKLN